MNNTNILSSQQLLTQISTKEKGEPFQINRSTNTMCVAHTKAYQYYWIRRSDTKYKYAYARSCNTVSPSPFFFSFHQVRMQLNSPSPHHLALLFLTFAVEVLPCGNSLYHCPVQFFGIVNQNGFQEAEVSQPCLWLLLQRMTCIYIYTSMQLSTLDLCI